MNPLIVASQKSVRGMVFAVATMMVSAAALAQPTSEARGHGGAAHHHGGMERHHGDVHSSFKHNKKWPQASLQAQAQAEVAHDTVHIILAAEISGQTQESVAQALTGTVKTTTERALENAGDVKVRTGNFRVWPMNDKDGNISNWRGRGEISLESTDFAAASKLAASVSDLMAVSSINFSVSPQARAIQEQQLLEQAARAFQDRAQALADALGYTGYALRSVDLGGAGISYETAARGMAASAMFKAADSIPLEGGTETVSVSIHGSVFLLDEKEESRQR